MNPTARILHHRLARIRGRADCSQALLLLSPYGPTQAFFDKTWKPDDIVKVK
jgi:hypothetical protein